jgi:hypothetical protein
MLGRRSVLAAIPFYDRTRDDASYLCRCLPHRPTPGILNLRLGHDGSQVMANPAQTQTRPGLAIIPEKI